MLPKNYKFHIVNNTGQQLDFNGNSANEKADLDLMTWEYNSDGELVYNSVVNLAYTATDVADGASVEFTGQDNSSTLAFGLHGTVQIQTDNASANGTVDLYVEWTTDGGTVFPSDAAQFNAEQDLGPPLVRVRIEGADTRCMAFAWNGD